MSLTTIRTAPFETGPLLVSDLPPVAAQAPTALSRALGGVRSRLSARRDARAFYRAVRFAGPDEASDLLAMRRRV